MIDSLIQQTAEHYRLREAISLRLSVSEDAIWLYEDISDFLSELLKGGHAEHGRLISAAPVAHELAMAADRAETEIIEAAPANPFSPDIESILNKTGSPDDIIYIANPSRVTGASFSLSHLRQIAASVPNGFLVVDEYYHDFFRVTASPITNQLNNVIILRPFENWSTASSRDCGFAVIGDKAAERFRADLYQCGMSRATAKVCCDRFNDEKSRVARVSSLQKQTLHLGSALTELGISCQITPTDFLLLEVSYPQRVCQMVAQFNVRIERVNGHSRLENFLRYRLTGTSGDSLLIEALKKIPVNYLTRKKRPGRQLSEEVDSHGGTGRLVESTEQAIDAVNE